MCLELHVLPEVRFCPQYLWGQFSCHLIQFHKKHVSLHFSLLDNLSFKTVASKCLFFSLRVKFERCNVFTFILGWGFFNVWKLLLCYFSPWIFPHGMPHPYLRTVIPFPIFQISYLHLCLFSLSSFLVWCFILSSTSLICLFYCFSYANYYFQMFFNSFIVFTMELQPLFCFGFFSDQFLLVIFWSSISFKVVITQFILFAPEAFQIPSLKN